MVYNAVHTLIKEYVVTGRGCLMNEHLVKEKPKPAEASVILFVYNTTKMPAPVYYIILYQICNSEFNRERLVYGTDVEVCVNKRETERAAQTYSVSDNKVSPSRERCWLSNRVQLLETKVTVL